MSTLTAHAQRSRYARRPRVGDRLDTFIGEATVTRVYGAGQSIEIADRLGRRWPLSRAPEGWWLRAPEEPTAAMVAPDGLRVEVIVLDAAAVYRVTEGGHGAGRYLVGSGYYRTPAEVETAVGEARYALLAPVGPERLDDPSPRT